MTSGKSVVGEMSMFVQNAQLHPLENACHAYAEVRIECRWCIGPLPLTLGEQGHTRVNFVATEPKKNNWLSQFGLV